MNMKENRNIYRCFSTLSLGIVILLSSFLLSPIAHASDHHEDIDLFKLFLRVFTEAEKKYVDEKYLYIIPNG